MQLSVRKPMLKKVQGLGEKTVPDSDFLVSVQDNLVNSLVTNHIPFFLEIIPPDIAFVKDGILNQTFAQEIASRHVGMAEVEMNRVMRCDAVKNVEFDQMVHGHSLSDISFTSKSKLSQIDVDADDCPVNKLFKLFHISSVKWEFGN